MLLRYFYNQNLAQASYFVGCQQTGEAIIIDPARDVEPYLEAAEAEGMRIVAATETHIPVTLHLAANHFQSAKDAGLSAVAAVRANIFVHRDRQPLKSLKHTSHITWRIFKIFHHATAGATITQVEKVPGAGIGSTNTVNGILFQSTEAGYQPIGHRSLKPLDGFFLVRTATFDIRFDS